MATATTTETDGTGVHCVTTRDHHGHLRAQNAATGRTVGYLVSDLDFALLLDAKRELAREGDGGGLVAMLVVAFASFVLTAVVLYGVWQHGRSYGVGQASFDRR